MNDSFSPGNVYMDKWHYPRTTIDPVGNPYYNSPRLLNIEDSVKLFNTLKINGLENRQAIA